MGGVGIFSNRAVQVGEIGCGREMTAEKRWNLDRIERELETIEKVFS